jgi:hypothetical protein
LENAGRSRSCEHFKPADLHISVDGGVNENNLDSLLLANVLVAGGGVFKAENKRIVIIVSRMQPKATMTYRILNHNSWTRKTKVILYIPYVVLLYFF